MKVKSKEGQIDFPTVGLKQNAFSIWTPFANLIFRH